jgi:hypothetical protein
MRYGNCLFRPEFNGKEKANMIYFGRFPKDVTYDTD